MKKKAIGNIDPALNDDYIEKIGMFFEWNDLHNRFGWSFEWFLLRCAEGNAPSIPSYNWRCASTNDTFDTNN